MVKIAVLVLLGLLISCQNKQAEIDYFGETPPGKIPKIFSNDVLSLENRWEGNASFSPDGKNFYFNVFQDSSKSIYHSHFENNKWSVPAPMLELKDQNTWEPFIGWDGKRLYFVSDRPPGNPEWNGRIWFLEAQGKEEWSQPKHLDLNMKTKNGLWFPNVSKNNKLYFGGSLKLSDSVGKGDLYAMDLAVGKIKTLTTICSEFDDWDPFVAPDESFILWASDRPGGFGGMDLYVSFKEAKNGNWGPALNLGEQINSENYEVAPRLSPDGKYLFFDRPKKGTQDMYWVSTQAITEILEHGRLDDEN